MSIAGALAVQNLPSGVHLSFNGKNGMYVSWMTNFSTSTSTVQYGIKPNVYTMNATGSSSAYYRTFHHHVELTNLSANTTYYYVCGDETAGFSKEFSFTTEPSTPLPFKIAVYGDMGITYSANTMKRVQALEDISFVYHIGDYAYADDRKSGDFESTWDSWQSDMEPITAKYPYMTLPGNHEASCHSYGSWFCNDAFDNFTAYRNRFRMPFENSKSPSTMFYSFDYGLVHFVSISTETDYPGSPEGPGTWWNAGPFGDQLKWLENDLMTASANRNERPFIIVGGHRPLYSTGVTDWPFGQVNITRKVFEPLFSKYNVDLYLSGHVHAYERLWPTYNDNVQKSYMYPSATSYIVHGCAGNIENHQTKWIVPDPEYLAFRNYKNFGYGTLEIHNRTALTWSFYGADDNNLIDEMTLFRKH